MLDEDTDDEMRRHHNVNATRDNDESRDLLRPSFDGEYDDKEAKRRKFIKWAVIGGIGLTIITLAIVLPIVLTKGGGKDPDNPPPPPPPPPPGPKPPVMPNSTNEYFLEQSSLKIGSYYQSGQIKISKHSLKESA